MPGIDDGSKMGRSSGNSIIGGKIQRDHAVRRHKLADEGGVMNHRQNRLLEVPRLLISSSYHEGPLTTNFVVRDAELTNFASIEKRHEFQHSI